MDEEGAPNAASDIWSLSATLWFALTGRMAFPYFRQQLQASAKAGCLRPENPVPNGFEDFFRTTFASAPGDRFSNGASWAAALDSAAEQAAWAGDDDAVA